MLNNQQHDIIQNKPPISVYKTSSQYPKTNSLFKMKISGSIPYIWKEKKQIMKLKLKPNKLFSKCKFVMKNVPQEIKLCINTQIEQ